MENREAEKGQKRGNVRGAAREANPRSPARTGATGRREKARNEFGLLELVASRGIEPRTRGFSIPELRHLLALKRIPKNECYT